VAIDLRLLAQIEQAAPKFEELPYYRALAAGEFTYQQTINAQLQDLGRSIACRGLREMQVAKLWDAASDGRIAIQDLKLLLAAIEDEAGRDSAPSHFEIRLQMFEPLGVSVAELETVQALPPAREASQIFRALFDLEDVRLTTIGVGAIEHWYVPVASRLFKLYRELRYSDHQLETYSLHAEVDQEHSRTALEFFSKSCDSIDPGALAEVLSLSFRSVRLYDDARYDAATSGMKYSDFLRRG
jgi:hypothetical protein